MESYGTNRSITNKAPLFIGIIVYTSLFVLSYLGLNEGKVQIIFLVLNLIGGWIGGTISGPGGIYNTLLLSFTVLGCFVIYNIITPDPLWFIGLIFIGFALLIFWLSWVVGATFKNKSKRITEIKNTP